jgi:hypothetical protein
MSTTGPRIGNLDFRDLAEGEVLGKFGGVAAGIAAQPTNQGKDFLVVDAQPLANTTSATLVNIPGASGVVNVPHDGTFVVALSLSFYITAAGSGAYFGLLVDGVTQYAPATWVRAANEANSHKDGGPFYVAIPLTKGQRTLQVQWRRSGTGTLTMDAGDRLQLLLSVPGGTATIHQDTIASLVQNVSLTGNTSVEASFPGTVSGGTLPSGNFVLPGTGDYTFTIGFNPTYTGSPSGLIIAYRLLIDGISVTPNTEWQSYIQAGDGVENRTERFKVSGLLAGNHTYALQWRKVSGTGAAAWGSVSLNVYRFSLSVEGGAAVNASLDARGEDESIVYVDNVAEGTANPANGPVFLGYTVEAGSLRGLSIGLDGGTVTAGTVNADLLINGSQVATVVLNTTNNTFAINNTDVPFVAKGSKVEVRIRTSGYTNSASTNLLVGVRGKISVSTIVQQTLAQIQAHVTASISPPSSATWVGVGTVLTFLNEFTDPSMVLATDVITFNKAGRYRLDFRFNWASTSVDVWLGLRARRTNNTPATLLKQVDYQQSATDYTVARLFGVFDASLGDTVQIQYAKNGGTVGTWSAKTIDGEALSLARLLIERVS